MVDLTTKPAAYLEGSTAVYRASSITACTKSLVAARLGLDGDAPPESMQRRFDDGHLHEPAILAEVERRYECTIPDDSKQKRYELDVMPKVIVRMHLDGIAHGVESGLDMWVTEAKALAQSTYDDWMKNGFKNFPYYAAQVSLQMEATGLPLLFAVKNKNSGKVDIKKIEDQPPIHLNGKVLDLAGVLNRIKVAEIRARKDDLPGPCDVRMFPCPFYRLHEDDEGEFDGLADAIEGEGEQEDFAALCKEYDEARELESDGKTRKKEAGRKLLEQYVADGAKTVKSDGWQVTRTPHTHRYLDEDAMRADGIPVEEYRREKFSEYVKVTRKEEQ